MRNNKGLVKKLEKIKFSGEWDFIYLLGNKEDVNKRVKNLSGGERITLGRPPWFFQVTQ